MPFPPTFTNVWDITQPFDTELANLLGQNIRDLKDDIMQRMSLLSGVLANRPTPETVDATWGGSGFGILFFATDTGQVFQWNGAAWVSISVASAKFSDLVVHTSINPTTGTIIGSSLTIPANTMQVGSIIEVSARMSWGPDTGATTINPFLRLGGTTITLPVNLLNTNGSLVIKAYFSITGLNSEIGFLQYASATPNPGFNSFSILYAGTDVAANAFTIQDGLTINGSTNTTFAFSYLTATVNI